MNDNDLINKAAEHAIDVLMELARSTSANETTRLEAAKALLEAYRWVDSKAMQERMMSLQADRSGGLFG